MSQHDVAVYESFTRQARTFEDAALNFAFIESLDLVLAAARPVADDIALDLAAGTGLVARALAPYVRQVTAVDITAEMLRTGKAAADVKSLHNVVFMTGAANDLPFLDASFSLAVTRFSLHHLADPLGALGQLVRVCRPGGRVVVFDLAASSTADVAAAQDRVEKLRDPSHLQMFTPDTLAAAMTNLGLSLISRQVHSIVHPLQPWLEQGGTQPRQAEQIRALLTGELAGGRATGMTPEVRDGELYVGQTWMCLVGAR